MYSKYKKCYKLKFVLNPQNMVSIKQRAMSFSNTRRDGRYKFTMNSISIHFINIYMYISTIADNQPRFVYKAVYLLFFETNYTFIRFEGHI